MLSVEQENRQFKETSKSLNILFRMLLHFDARFGEFPKIRLGVESASVAECSQPHQIPFKQGSIQSKPAGVLGKHLFPQIKNIQAVSVEECTEPSHCARPNGVRHVPRVYAVNRVPAASVQEVIDQIVQMH